MKRAGLNIGVAGAGVFGALHGAKLASDARVRLVGVYDRDAVRAHALAARFGIQAFTDYPVFLESLDAVSIATAATAHYQQARTALARGRAVYVEKPLATNAADGAALVEAARAAGVVLACGHQERLVLRDLGLLGGGFGPPLRITAHRLGPPSGRGQDVSVFLDLMVHDADLAMALIGAPVERVEGRVLAQREGGLADAGEAEIGFGGGARAILSVSRVASRKDRRLRLEYPTGRVEIDFVSGGVRDGAGFGLPDRLPPGDPLGASLAAFVSAVLGEMPGPAVSGNEGLAALELVLRAEGRA